jgi:hypothetical protein
MKRSFVLVALITLLALGSYAIFAQQQPAQTQPAPQNQPPAGGDDTWMMQGGAMGGGMGRGMMQGGMGPMGGPGCRGCGMAMAALAHESVTATSDGGVVVAVAGTLIKYNASLQKVAETNVEVDWAQVHQRMQQIMQNCPMRAGQRGPQPRGGQPRGTQQPPAGGWQGQPNP